MTGVNPWFLFALGLVTLSAWAGDPSVERGRAIYLKGAAPDGAPIMARMGEPSVEVPASALPCAGCHGKDGRGRAEGGLDPSNITWSALSRPYNVVSPTGRTRKPYTERLLTRAITTGVDSAGNSLQTAMPRYQLSLKDAADLAAYIQQLEQERDPGLTPDTVVVGVLLPPSTMKGPAGAVRSAINAYAQRLNQNGGIYGRTLTPVFLTLPAAPHERTSAAADFLARRQPFALVASYLSGAHEPMARLAEKEGIPIVGVFDANLPQISPPNRYLFYLLPGVGQMGGALANSGLQTGVGTAIVYTQTYARAAQDIQDACAQNGWTATPTLEKLHEGNTSGNLAVRLASSGVKQVFCLGFPSENEERAFFQKAKALNWRPHLLAPGVLAGPALLDAASHFQQITLAWAMPPGSGPRQVHRDYAELTRTWRLPQNPSTVHTRALAAISLLENALLASGRQVSREGVIEHLETLFNHQTQYTPAVTYSPNRRIGSNTVYLMGYDSQSKRFTQPVPVQVKNNRP